MSWSQTFFMLSWLFASQLSSKAFLIGNLIGAVLLTIYFLWRGE